MLRFITAYADDIGGGIPHRVTATTDVEAPEVEEALDRGGFGEEEFHLVQVIGAESLADGTRVVIESAVYNLGHLSKWYSTIMIDGFRLPGAFVGVEILPEGGTP